MNRIRELLNWVNDKNLFTSLSKTYYKSRRKTKRKSILV